MASHARAANLPLPVDSRVSPSSNVNNAECDTEPREKLVTRTEDRESLASLDSEKRKSSARDSAERIVSSKSGQKRKMEKSDDISKHFLWFSNRLFVVRIYLTHISTSYQYQNIQCGRAKIARIWINFTLEKIYSLHRSREIKLLHRLGTGISSLTSMWEPTAQKLSSWKLLASQYCTFLGHHLETSQDRVTTFVFQIRLKMH